MNNNAACSVCIATCIHSSGPCSYPEAYLTVGPGHIDAHQLPALLCCAMLSCPTQQELLRQAQEPRTPPRHAAAIAATATPGSPRTTNTTTTPRSPLHHSRSRGRADAAGSGNDEEGSGLPGFGQGLIAAAACFLLRQAPDDAAPASTGVVAAGGAKSDVIPIDPVSSVVPVGFVGFRDRGMQLLGGLPCNGQRGAACTHCPVA